MLVQHLDPKHESMLTTLLSHATTLPIHEARDGMRIEANHIYVIPPNTNLAVLHGRLSLMPRTEERVQHMPVDFFFRSLAADQESGAIGVILSGCRAARRGRRPTRLRSRCLSSLEKARAGIYPAGIAADVSAGRLRRFFAPHDAGFQISKPVRDLCVFARQDVTKDPPFSKLDLISCRNLLIYLGPALQKPVLQTFHYALKPGGHLLLGGSETIGGFAELFALIDGRNKLSARKPRSTAWISSCRGRATWRKRRSRGGRLRRRPPDSITKGKPTESCSANTRRRACW